MFQSRREAFIDGGELVEDEGRAGLRSGVAASPPPPPLFRKAVTGLMIATARS